MTSPKWSALKAKKNKDRSARNRAVPFASSKQLQLKRAEEARAAKGISKVVDWFDKRGYEVRFGDRLRDELYPSLKRVTICSRPSLMSQLIALLHEAGHVLIYADPSYDERFGRGWSLALSGSAKDKATNAHRVQVVEEEIEAWNRGQRLSGRLRVTFNQDLWKHHRNRCVAHYCGYATKSWEMGEIAS